MLALFEKGKGEDQKYGIYLYLKKTFLKYIPYPIQGFKMTKIEHRCENMYLCVF